MSDYERFLEEAQREVDAMLPGTPPIAPPLPPKVVVYVDEAAVPWWKHFDGVCDPMTGDVRFPDYKTISAMELQLLGIDALRPLSRRERERRQRAARVPR